MRLAFMIVLALLPNGISLAQVDVLDFMDMGVSINPDDIVDEIYWKQDSLFVDSLLDDQNGIFRRRISSQSILNFKIGNSSEEVFYRYRTLLKSNEFNISYLTQANYHTSGIMLSPNKGNLKLVMGDFHLDHGLGVLFTTRRRFKSWSQNPHKLLYRARGLKVNTSSDSTRFLRGGGISYTYRKLKISGIFSDKNPFMNGNKSEGLFMNYLSDNFHCGGGLVHLGGHSGNLYRYGGHMKVRLPGAVAFAEVASVFDAGYALEVGLSFFGSDSHQFIFLYDMRSEDYYQLFTKMMTNKNPWDDRRNLEFNYLWEWKNDHFFQLDVVSKESFGLKDRSLSAFSDWRIRIGIRRQHRDGRILLSKIGLDEEGFKVLVKHRHILNQNGAYFQTELGYSLSDFNNGLSKYNSFLGIDGGIKSAGGKLTVKSGFCIHRGEKGSILLYRYEPDMFYQMSLPVISGSGLKGYVVCKYKIKSDLHMEFKLSRMVYFDRKETVRSQVKIQMVYRPTFLAQSSLGRSPGR